MAEDQSSNDRPDLNDKEYLSEVRIVSKVVCKMISYLQTKELRTGKKVWWLRDLEADWSSYEAALGNRKIHALQQAWKFAQKKGEQFLQTVIEDANLGIRKYYKLSTSTTRAGSKCIEEAIYFLTIAKNESLELADRIRAAKKARGLTGKAWGLEMEARKENLKQKFEKKMPNAQEQDDLQSKQNNASAKARQKLKAALDKTAETQLA